MAQRSVDWIVCEMDLEMKNHVEQQINKAIDQKETEKEQAEFVKKFFDSTYGPNWHCCVGKHFASYVTYQSKHYIFFYIGQLAILLYKLWAQPRGASWWSLITKATVDEGSGHKVIYL